MAGQDSTADVDPYERGVQHGRRLGAYGALALARRTLREAGPLPLAQALSRLTGPDDLALVVRALEDAVDRAEQVLRAMREDDV
jgi:hypothetical protein